ncbi:cyclic nucleotide-binding protein [Corallococcus sp. CA053C]|uniref:TIR domain-containing protein n=1 Tax=Corallococcus sp. CA053C TaxID=2316732 RepID=UPI000EA15631|nr:TIR domain-containing protein [Corallococcus sp. CA053C]RKH01749.1 cyclic nucleotide-binding protein [Corallococcus sp. CA053C]
MKARYEGDAGRRLLIEALKQQAVVQHNAALAELLADAGALVEFKPGESLMTQNDTDNSIFFILSGTTSVFINGRHVADRGPREPLGEMALIDPSAPRAATVTARESVTALRILEAEFHRVADSHPTIWRAMALVMAERLRQRNRFHRPPNERPVMFVGSSAEGLLVARHLQLGLKHSPIEVRLWTNGIFGPSGVTIDDLLKQVDNCDFAAFIFGPDDHVSSRNTDQDAPRDNVIFELGLFMGRVGRERAFLIKERSTDLKIPSDLLGVTALTYIAPLPKDIPTALSAVCTEIEIAANRLGTR